MNLSKTIRVTVQDLFSPEAAALDIRRRQRRTLILSILFGVVFATAFGFALYHLNDTGRLHR